MIGQTLSHYKITAKPGEGSEVTAHDLRTGEIRELLSTAPDLAAWPMLGPDGKTLHFIQQSASSDIHLLEAKDPS